MSSSNSTFDLCGKVVIVTGASSGMGAAIARAVATAGASVVAVGRDEVRLGQTVLEIGDAGGTGASVAIDLLSDSASDVIVARTVERFGRIDGIVHAAGIYRPKPFAETPLSDLQVQWETNVQAPYALTQKALAHLRKARGSVVFFSSIFGTVGGAADSAYCASKGGVSLLTKALADELARDGINFNCIAPGAIETPMNERFRREEPGYYEACRDAAPAQRWGTVDDITGPTVFLLSAAADFVHGQVLHVDGGYVSQ